MRSNWFIQLIGALIAATLLWWAIFSLGYQTFELDIPLEIVNLESDLAVASPLTTIHLSTRGQRFNFLNIQDDNSDIKATLDFKDVKTYGLHSINPEIDIGVKGVRLLNYEPKSFEVSITPKSEASLEVFSDVVGYPDSGYSLGDITIEPKQVLVYGSKSLINEQAKVYIKINVNKKQKTFSATAEPEIRDGEGAKLNNFSFSPQFVTAKVIVKTGDSLKTVGLQPSFDGEPQSGYWVSTIVFNPPALTIRGSADKLAGINHLLTSPINISNQTSSFTDKVSVELPAGVTLLEANLVDVRVDLRTASNNRQITLLPTYANITEGLSVTSVSPPTVMVTLSGPTDKLAGLSRANILLDLDLRGTLSGNNQIELSKEMFSVPADIEVVSFEPSALELMITKNN